MVKRLLIMRHAKSSWKTGAQTDHQRPLNGRGQRDAPAMGRLLKALELIPAVVFSSDSTRTQETFEWMWSAMEHIDPIWTSDLYLGGLNQIIGHCQTLDATTQSALFLGHNPGFSHAVSWLSNTMVELKTAHIAVLEAHHDHWARSMTSGCWHLSRVLTPQDAHGLSTTI